MAKFIRLDDETFGYLTELALPEEAIALLRESFSSGWPGKRLLIVEEVHEFIDLTGEFEIVPVAEASRLRDAAGKAIRLIEDAPVAHVNLTDAQVVLSDALRDVTPSSIGRRDG